MWKGLRALPQLGSLAHRGVRWSSVSMPSGPPPPEPRRVGALARKIGMTNLWDSSGARHPVTVLCIDRCHVVQVKEPNASDRRNRWGIQVGAGPKRPYKTNKAQRYHFAKAGVEPKQEVVEFQVDKSAIVETGTEIRADHFTAGQFVDVTGISIGKGFQGPMKRWGFKGGSATHGNSKAHRAHGSTGMSTAPGRVFKGKKMAGRMGGDRTTVQSLRLLRVDPERNFLFVRGCVPGKAGNWIRVRDAIKKLPQNQDKAELEAAIVSDGFRSSGTTEFDHAAASGG